MGARSLMLALQDIGNSNFAVPRIGDNAHIGLRCRSLPFSKATAAVDGMQPCTLDALRIAKPRAIHHNFQCLASGHQFPISAFARFYSGSANRTYNAIL